MGEDKNKQFPSRWLILGTCLLVQSLSGTAYSYSLFSGVLKNRLGLSQVQLDSVGSAGHIGLYLSIIPGIFINRNGPSKALLIGCFLATLGFSLITLVALKAFGTSLSPTLWTVILCTLMAVYQHGNAWMNACSVVTTARAIPATDRAAALGMVKAYFGLSSALVSEFKTGLCGNNVSLFMVAICVLIPTGILSVARFVVFLPKELALNYQSNAELGFDLCSFCSCKDTAQNRKSMAESRRLPSADAQRYDALDTESHSLANAYLSPWFLATAVFAIYLISASLLQKLVNLPFKASLALFVLAICVWLLPFAIARVFHGPLSTADASAGLKVDTSTLDLSTTDSVLSADTSLAGASPRGDEARSAPLLSSLAFAPINAIILDTDSDSKENEVESESGSGAVESATTDVGIDTLVKELRFYMTYAVFALMSGSGLCLINNISQIVESLNSDKDDPENENESLADVLVSLVSFCNFLGRICSGALLKVIIQRYTGAPTILLHQRFAALGIMASLMSGGFVLLVFFDHSSYLLFVPVAAVGLGFGWLFGSMIILCSQMYGTRYLAGNYALLNNAAMVGSLVFATGVSGAFYDRRGHEEGEGKHCYGRGCFEWTFAVCAVNCAIACILCFALSRMQRAADQRATDQRIRVQI